jgi:hypothetical protein
MTVGIQGSLTSCVVGGELLWFAVLLLLLLRRSSFVMFVAPVCSIFREADERLDVKDTLTVH